MRVGDVAKQLHVSGSKVRAMANNGEIHCEINKATGQRYFTQQDIDEYLGKENNPQIAFYVRASNGNNAAIQAQIDELTNEYGEPNKGIYKDRLSGLNENRPGLLRLIKDAEKGKINKVYATYPDRISRFGVTYIEHILEQAGCKIEYTHPNTKYSLEEELMNDFMSLIASFSGRFYRLRGKQEQQKLLNEAEKRIQG